MRYKIIFFILTILISTYGYNQELTNYIQGDTLQDSNAFNLVEEMPQFPGGDAARVMYLSQNIRYPLEAREKGIQGRVFITFVIEEDGAITNAKVIQGIGGGCDEVALHAIKNMPNWIPGKLKGEPVRVQFNMPILFKISGGNSSKGSSKTKTFEKANTLMDKKNYAKAIEKFSIVISSEGFFTKQSYLSRGICKYHLENYEGATQDIKQAIDLGAIFNNEKLSLVYFNIGSKYLDKKEYNKALESYNESLKLTPEDGNVYFNLGIVNFYLDNRDQACKDIHMAEKLGKEEASKIIEERCK